VYDTFNVQVTAMESGDTSCLGTVSGPGSSCLSLDTCTSCVGSVSNFNVSPWLSVMTVYTLCTPATSAPVERALSTGKSGLFVCPHPGQIRNNFLVS